MEQLLLDIHQFMVGYQRIVPSPSPEDIPFRTIKTVLFHLTNTGGSKVSWAGGQGSVCGGQGVKGQSAGRRVKRSINHLIWGVKGLIISHLGSKVNGVSKIVNVSLQITDQLGLIKDPKSSKVASYIHKTLAKKRASTGVGGASTTAASGSKPGTSAGGRGGEDAEKKRGKMGMVNFRDWNLL